MERSGDRECLVVVAKKGDRAALSTLLADGAEELERYVGGKIPEGMRSTIAVEDVLQETFVQACRDIQDCRASSLRGFRAWLKGIARNRLRDAVKAERRRKRAGGDGAPARPADKDGSILDLAKVIRANGETPSGRAAQQEAVRAIRIALATLPEDQREAVRRQYLEGNTIGETAAAMGRTLGAVRGLIYRAKQSLREALGRSSRWFGKK